MTREVRIEGIYDERSLLELKSEGVFNFSFDFRPLSFNFLQQHVFLELWKKKIFSQTRLFLHYQDEQAFVIQKMLDDIEALGGDSSAFFLEFSDSKEASFYEQFKKPFYWHYRPDSEFHHILDCHNLRGIVLDYSFLKEVRESDHFRNFVQNFFQLTYEKIERGELELILALDWDSDIFPSLFEFIDFDLLSLPINHKVEVCYRNVDLSKAKAGLRGYTQKII